MSTFSRSPGPLQSLDLVVEKSKAPRTRRNRVVFAHADWMMTFELTAEPEIAGMKRELAW
jgi:hypothetical protein